MSFLKSFINMFSCSIDNEENIKEEVEDKIKVEKENRLKEKIEDGINENIQVILEKIKSDINTDNNQEKSYEPYNSIEEKEIEETEFFKKIKEVNTFIKFLEKLKLTEYINIPKICSIGNQSNGKTSILTSIIGLDILPKGNGVVTRRPLELRLNNIKSGKPYFYFDEDKKNIITDIQCIKHKIKKFTNSTCGNNKNIKDIPLVLNIFSQTCPNLTIIDLPGIVRVPIGDQPKNIEQITKEMTLRYINDPYTIILCAIDANQDISTSDGLYLAKEIDYYGERTLGVLTKVDLMDIGTDCKDILLNKLIPLKLGYIAVKNRSKMDLINNVSIKKGLEKEKKFFENHEIYNKMDKKLFGTESLIERLVELYTDMFYKNIGDIIISINEHIRRINKELLIIGKPVPQSLFEKNIFMNDLIKNYCDNFVNILNFKTNYLTNAENSNDLITHEESIKIKNLYDYFLLNLYLGKKNCIKLPSDLSNINSTLDVLAPNLKNIENESIILYEIIVEHLFKLSHNVIHKVFKRFNLVENKIRVVLDNFFKHEVEKTKNILEKILKCELTYEFTNDKEFLKKYNNKKIIEYKYNKTIFQNALNDYYLIIIRNIRNIIPKTIQYNLFISLKKNLYNNLMNYFIKNQELLNDLKESDNYIKLRQDLNNNKNELEKLLRKIHHSPSISKSLFKFDKNERKKQILLIQKEKRDKRFKNSLKKLKEIRFKK